MSIGFEISTTDAEEPSEVVAQETETSPTRSPPPPRPRTPPPPPGPDPKGTVTGTCNGLLDSDLRGGDLGRYKFLATVRVQNTDNTGNTGNEAEVRAEFELLGTEPLRNVERATVEVGDTAAVHFNGNIDRDAWLRFADAGRSCDVGAEIVDVFGEIGG